jgi:hypothetical protein
MNGKKSGIKIFDRDLMLSRRIYGNYKISAKNRGLEFSMTIQDIYGLIHKPCFYCGIVDENTHNAARLNTEEKIKYNGIDRKNTMLGYVKNNIVPCCSMCNTAKLNHTEEEFKEWLIRAYRNMIGGF